MNNSKLRRGLGLRRRGEATVTSRHFADRPATLKRLSLFLNHSIIDSEIMWPFLRGRRDDIGDDNDVCVGGVRERERERE